MMSSSSLRLGCAWLTLFVIGTDLFVVSPLLPALAADLDVAPARSGWCVTVFSVTYMIAAPALGRAADAFGRTRLLLVALLAFAAANLYSGMTWDFAGLLAARIAAGLSAAGVTPSVYALIGDSAPADRRATWFAVAVSGLLLSLPLGAPLGTLIAGAFGWRSVFLAVAAASCLLLPLNRAAWRAASGPAKAAGDRERSGFLRMAPMLAPTAVWSTALYAVYTYLGVGLAGWGYAPERIAGAVMCYGAGAVVGALCGGRLADRFGAGRVCIISLGGLGAALFALGPAFRAGVPIELLLAAISALAQLFFPAQQARLARDFESTRATAMAWNNSALFLGIGTGSLIGGAIMARGDLVAVATVSAVIAIAGACLVGMVAAGRTPAAPARPV
jgi:predicted MFS family arabinose efflux permease